MVVVDTVDVQVDLLILIIDLKGCLTYHHDVVVHRLRIRVNKF